MRQKNIQDLELDEIDLNYQITYSINENRDVLIKHSSNGITTELKSYIDFQTITKFKHINQQTKMNYNIHFDIMSEISNYINNQDSSLRMCTVQLEQQRFEQIQIQFQLIYAITFEYGYQIKEKEIDDAIVQISSRIDQICVQTYNHGDANLMKQIDELFEQYQEIFN
ncbi:unnamed protein product (macronuclear) [Paramecium tetraurelia]|uniref:Uncharacterized protein n=1 Tax=Paramecium tetraurelia TaxID=5888 RepID=A0DJP6_PARTE|nr:uncharacterized protein GSPATT00017607001 [Paramecium tetraurelia]CAK83263.1 unnamed protein product [Paramecium tetraurelia]|eukprot:XP_001450660.1 hypothetical protein (macronuclear) [Paramecium tetraurelia strain d4-2]